MGSQPWWHPIGPSMAHGKPLHALTEEHTAVGFNTDRVVINTHKIGSMDPALKIPTPVRFKGQHYTNQGLQTSLRGTINPDSCSKHKLS